MKRLQIFKPGRHIATNGKTYDFNEAILAASAAAYDPAKYEAPLVIGHPKSDDPAYGWVKSLAFSGVLEAELDQVETQFAEMVNAGRFKKVSASFYPPGHSQNPAPEVYYLRHVGFLGAQPPAVKGLKPASFADNEQGVVEFADWGGMQNASLWRRLRDWFIGEKGLEVADNIIPDYAVSSLEDAARLTNEPAATPAYAETEEEKRMKLTQEQLDSQAKDIKEREDKLTAERAEFAERDKALKAQEAAQRRSGLAGIIEKLVDQGKVLPAHKEGLIAFMGVLDDSGTVEFGEGEKKQSKPAIAWFTEYLTAQPKIVEFKEIAAGAAAYVDLTDPKKIAAKALEFKESEQKAGRTISITEAVQHITGGNK